jgi:hypothetical protein
VVFLFDNPVLKYRNARTSCLIIILVPLIHINTTLLQALSSDMQLFYTASEHYTFNRTGLSQQHYRPPVKAVHCGTYLHTRRNKTVNVDKIKHIFIVLVHPTKSVFKQKKEIPHHDNYII